MTGAPQSRLLQAIYALLRPLARVLIRSGVTYAQFAELARLAFVQEAYLEQDGRGRSINASRVSVKTGISRKEVRRIREHQLHVTAPPLGQTFQHAATPAQVLHCWYSNPLYLDSAGVPRALPQSGPSPSFVELVRSVSGDVPPGAIKAELKQAGAIDELDDGTVRVLKRFYVPKDFDDRAAAIVSGMLFPMAAGLAHNADPSRTADGFIQRIAFSRSLDEVEIINFRRWARVQSADFLESMNNWLAVHERAPVGGSSGPQGPLVCVGVFYYEGPSADEEGLTNQER